MATRPRNRQPAFLPALLAVLLSPGTAVALGTQAGASISNTATADYVIGGSAATATSNSVTLRVDEKLDLNLVWQDAGAVGVGTPDNGRILTYRLTNTGNGNDSYALSVDNTPGGDQFDPNLVDIYLDANANGIFESGVDTLYVPGANDPVLGADGARVIFVRNNIPALLNNGDRGDSRLIAISNTASGVPGTAFVSAGDSNTAAVIGTTGGRTEATGTYAVTATTVALSKRVVITDPSGGSQPVPGATLTYSIDATVTGSGTATGVVIADPLPANTTYAAGSLSLNATALSDAADADAGDVGGTTANAVTVYLGDLTTTSSVQTISFAVVIN